MGNHRVVSALSTLAFDYPPRSRFFRKELEAFLLLTREEGKSPLELKGSYAGAMGYGQFMPSSYRAYAVDSDRDGKRDIWNSRADAIGSVANYLSAHNWEKGAGVATRVELDSESRELSENLFSDIRPNLTGSQLLKIGFKVLSESAGLAQFYDRDTPPEMAKEGMKGFQEFMVKPDREKQIRQRIERARKRIFKK